MNLKPPDYNQFYDGSIFLCHRKAERILIFFLLLVTNSVYILRGSGQSSSWVLLHFVYGFEFFQLGAAIKAPDNPEMHVCVRVILFTDFSVFYLNCLTLGTVTWYYAKIHNLKPAEVKSIKIKGE